MKATDTTGDEFESRWLQRLGLPSAWREPARKHLEQLCFSVLQDTWPLIESLFTVVPEILNREPERMDLAEAYGCYLWAMKGDEPLLMKPSVVFTPFGTQIFIPGYISFDPKRDLKLGIVSELHRARGIRRQGEGFSVGRIDRTDRAKRAAELNEQAKAKGLEGDGRLRFIANELRITTREDYREIRRLIEEGNKLMGK